MKRKRSELLQEKTVEPPKYVMDGNFRRVLPYYFEYSAFAKERWCGRSLIDVFSTDFKDKPSFYYESAIKSSLITVNGRSITTDYTVKPNDVISHLIHRHEPPVLNTSIEVVFEDENVLAVNKPPSIPVHPSGRYNHNTLVGILKHEKGLDHLSVINRLDRVTSGIVILAKNNGSASKWHQNMEDGVLKKQYICKVKGDFPDDIKSCDAPIKTANFKLGLNVVAPDGKECLTNFEKLLFDGEYSYLKAMPVTGRTHQIRVHLHHLGFHIVNDPLYNDATVWKEVQKANPTPEDIQKIVNAILAGEEKEYEGGKGVIDEVHTCLDCAIPKPDPIESDLYICLHAYQYSGPDFEFTTEYPEWAKPAIKAA